MRTHCSGLALLVFGGVFARSVGSPSSPADAIVGHLKPLGAHQPPRDDIDVETGFPPAKRFFEEYVSQSKPVIMRGAADGWPARFRWTDPYFRDQIGSKEVEIEFHKKEDRSGDGDSVSFGEFLDYYDADGLANTPLTDLDGVFSETGQDFAKEVTTLNDNASAASSLESSPYKGMGGIYHVHEVDPKLWGDMWLPKGYWAFTSGFLRAPIMWMSSGSTSSVLHNDGDDNINCVVDGRKVITLMNSSDEGNLYNSAKWSGYGARSPVDTSSVDLEQWPRVAQSSWWHVELQPGDCVFMPMAWMHAVRTPPGRSIAVNLWFNALIKPKWAESAAIRPAPADSGSTPTADWEEPAHGDGGAEVEDETWQPEHVGAWREEAKTARARSIDTARGSGAQLWAEARGPLEERLYLSDPVWGFGNSTKGGVDAGSRDDISVFVHRDELWLDRWLEGLEESLTPPWGDRDIAVPDWLEAAATERRIKGAASDDDSEGGGEEEEEEEEEALGEYEEEELGEYEEEEQEEEVGDEFEEEDDGEWGYGEE